MAENHSQAIYWMYKLTVVKADVMLTQEQKGNAIQHNWTCKVTLSHSAHSSTYSFHVVDHCWTDNPWFTNLHRHEASNPELQSTTAEAPSTLKQAGNPETKANILTQYTDVFQGIGSFKGEYHITLDSTVPPVIHPPRRVPEILREPLRNVSLHICLIC